MYVTPQVKERVAKKVNECVNKANLYFGRTYTIPPIHYDVRGTNGGYHQSGAVHFNPTLLMENVEIFMERTVPHEVAHHIDTLNGDNARPVRDVNRVFNDVMSGRRPRRAKRSIHGPSWEKICRIFGMTDIERCHKYDVSNAQVKIKNKFEYKCGGCSQAIFMSSVRHNKFRQGRSTYWCSKCGRDRGSLTLVRNLGQKTHGELIAMRNARTAKFIQPTFVPKGDVTPTPVQSAYDPKPLVSNMDRARKMYSMYSHLGRGVCIRKMVECGIKDTTASTYYQNFRSGK